MNTDPLVAVRGLSAGYPAPVVHGVSFDIARGDTLALVGESGSGKTTVARAMLRLIRHHAGHVHMNGTDLFALHGVALRRARRRMQIVFQDPYSSLNPRMRIGDAIAEGLRVDGDVNARDAAARVQVLLNDVGLDVPPDRYPHEMSGGQRQRVAIARALAVEPEFLVLDEAVSSLDVTTQARLLDVFERIRRSHALTCLFIAHNLAVVQRVATSVAVMYRGRIVEHAPAASLFSRPLHPYTRALIDAVPIPDPRVRRARLPVADVVDDTAPSHGCPYFASCRHVEKDATCTAALPSLDVVESGHVVACIKVRKM